jgi:hypothetical protein
MKVGGSEVVKKKNEMIIIITLYVVTMMYVCQINVCMHRLMFVEKEGFGKGVR